MRIALIAHVRHPIAPPFMGGMEAHSWHLARALMGRGHDVTLFAAGDSDPQFSIHPVLPEHYETVYPWNDYVETHVLHDYLDSGFAAACRALLYGGFDVIHNNSLHRYPPRLARAHRLPMVTSLHIPPFDTLHRAVRESAAPWSLFTVTSAKQLECWWPEGPPPEAHVVHNGIDLLQWRLRAKGDGSAVWAGRISRNKAPHLAAEAARRLNLPLTLFGHIEDRAYFDASIAPLLGTRIRYGGHVKGGPLAEEIGRASILLFTPLWDEPFGLVAVEAMACGLPVAALDMGAAREIIGEAGCFAPPDDPAAFDRAITQALAIPRPIPRARVERYFTLDRMVGGYEDLYQRAIEARNAHAPAVDFPPIELRLTPPPVAKHAGSEDVHEPPPN
ncbi:glycosyltransferase [Falsirhodobacter xinxiangensis]|uniref:glycosyltransferase n=1 Tax=Falsirhodobacter xinxiangensis TaxID=2530049 RepID=UPI0010A99F2C|nr:glycosyltransferase [Rhodobacter xinxiangensis]